MARIPILKSQALLVLIGLPVLALTLHLTFCEWHWKAILGTVGNTTYNRRELLSFSHGAIPPSASMRSGLFARHSVEAAKLCGIIIPLALLAVQTYLVLGWRYQARARRGLCPNCGYDLKGAKSQPCPECGHGAMPGSTSDGT